MDSKKLRVLMVGVDHKTKGGMWSVARSYLQSSEYQEVVDLTYVPVATTGSSLTKIVFFFFGVIKILVHLVAHKCDIVHIHMSERGSVYRKLIILRLAKAFHCKVILHMHGAEFESWYSGMSTSKKQLVKSRLSRADCILILGEYWRNFVSSLMEDKQRIRVLYNAVQVPAINRYNANAKNLLFLGEVGERKGVYDILEAMSIVDEQLDDCQLLIYGINPDGDIVNRIKERELQHRVRYMGWADSTQFEQLFSGIAVNVLPSYHEGLPMTILETMANGIPNITTDIAAISEVVSQDNGVLIQPGDTGALANAIVCLLRDQDVRETKSRNAYRTVKAALSIEHHMSELIRIYKGLMTQER